MAPSTLPAAQVEQLDFSETVTVVVGSGSSKQHFVLHKHIICRHSKFFRAALLGNFVEAKKRVVKLPETDPAVFKIWIQWAYSGNLVLLNASEQEVETEQSLLSNQRSGEVYVLADLLEDTLCRNAITDMLRDKLLMKWGPSTDLYKIAYEMTPESSKLRRVCLDWKLANAGTPYLTQFREELPAAFFVDLAIGWEKDLSKSKFTEIHLAPKCKYHDHDEEVPACEGEA